MADETNTEKLTGRDSITAGTYIDGELQMTPSQKAMAGNQPAPKTVSMDVLRDGSYAGEYHHVGGTVDVPEDHVDTLTLSGFAARADRAEVAQQARDAAERDRTAAETKAADKAAARTARRSTAVKPLTTHDVPGVEPPKQE